MRVVQALHWLKDLLASEPDTVLPKLAAIVAEPAVRNDLRSGQAALPAWMQTVVRRLLDGAPATAHGDTTVAAATKPDERINRGNHRRRVRPRGSATRTERRA